ncbi:oligogalacturonate lyase family protein [Aquibacillus rhizosphaerae]|uniref:Oligogalacturonate lyase family protein n=1 Tax=Aquibacillus rhizosphaerae TaxID=3051431 RepID=A0ABT7L9R0_9BACI|nr:oligogalacturonate lyase family protein [Aquibacillus sp. LR5S19]MDL4842611.1 oligogalacturonate lyase family protein [Aquibacillus sp. LR5S19]
MLQIMGKGKVWLPEWKQYKDRITGVSITQLTDYTGHSHHLYFTENGWYDNDNKLLFCSDRENKTNLFSIDIQSGEIVQLTDHDTTYGNLSTCLDTTGKKAYFRRRNQLIEIDLENLNERLIYEGPADLVGGNINCTTDGKSIITCVHEDFSSKFTIDLKNGYVGHRKLMESKPKSQIMEIDIEKGKERVVHEEENFITHINTSPKHSHLITFCHEGPWQLVDHRIWGLNLKSGEAWKIRERKRDHEMVGHEYWYPDGEHIGYHGFRQKNGTGFFGKIRYDNTAMEEVEFDFINWHAHSFGFDKVVVDGRAPLHNLIVWQKENGVFSKPKILCEHRCSFHVQKVHAHPRFTPSGDKLLFTSDRNGYGNIYLVDLPTVFEQLPDY